MLLQDLEVEMIARIHTIMIKKLAPDVVMEYLGLFMVNLLTVDLLTVDLLTVDLLPMDLLDQDTLEVTAILASCR